jgi:hypothetical protein
MENDKPDTLEVEVPINNKSISTTIQKHLEKSGPRLVRAITKEALTTIVDIIDDIDNQESVTLKVTVPSVSIETVKPVETTEEST